MTEPKTVDGQELIITPGDDGETYCQFCQNGDNGGGCPASRDYFCCRGKGHDGPHVACTDTDHAIEVWEDEA